MGQRIAEMRAHRALSQEELAAKAKIHRVTLADIERGTAQPTLDTLVKLAAALRVPITRLFHPRL